MWFRGGGKRGICPKGRRPGAKCPEHLWLLKCPHFIRRSHPWNQRTHDAATACISITVPLLAGALFRGSEVTQLMTTKTFVRRGRKLCRSVTVLDEAKENRKVTTVSHGDTNCTAWSASKWKERHDRKMYDKHSKKLENSRLCLDLTKPQQSLKAFAPVASAARTQKFNASTNNQHVTIRYEMLF